MQSKPPTPSMQIFVNVDRISNPYSGTIRLRPLIEPIGAILVRIPDLVEEKMGICSLENKDLKLSVFDRAGYIAEVKSRLRVSPLPRSDDIYCTFHPAENEILINANEVLDRTVLAGRKNEILPNSELISLFFTYEFLQSVVASVANLNHYHYRPKNFEHYMHSRAGGQWMQHPLSDIPAILRENLLTGGVCYWTLKNTMDSIDVRGDKGTYKRVFIRAIRPSRADSKGKIGRLSRDEPLFVFIQIRCGGCRTAEG